MILAYPLAIGFILGVFFFELLGFGTLTSIVLSIMALLMSMHLFMRIFNFRSYVADGETKERYMKMMTEKGFHFSGESNGTRKS